MFFTYLRRELRRRARQSSIIALGLAVGIGLVITVSALSTGVKGAQAEVLHSLYGVGTDVTVTKAPEAGSGPGAFGFHGGIGSQSRPAAGTKIDVDSLTSLGHGTLDSSTVSAVGRLHGVAAAAGGLTLTDTKITGKIPSINFNQGSGGASGAGGPPSTSEGSGGAAPPTGFSGSLTPTTITVDGVQLADGELGPLSSGTLASGRTFRATDATSDVAVIERDYATQHSLHVGSTVTLAKHAFTVIGIVSVPAGSSGTDVYIPLGRAQALAGLTGKVNAVYVAASSSTQIDAVSKEVKTLLPSATVTDSSSLASEITGSVANASSLADNLGRWLAIAVLIAAFLLASLLTMAGVSRRVREFGTLKALGWRTRRVVGQVLGESVVVGVIGGVVGVGLGFVGARLVTTFAPPLTAALGQSTGSATPGGAQTFGAFPGGAPGGGPGGGESGGPPSFSGGFDRLAGAADSVTVHLTAPVTLAAVAIAVLLAVLGGVVAGVFGGWRAARLRPADALAKIG